LALPMPRTTVTRAELQRHLDAERERLRVPGVAVGVIAGGRETVAVSGVTSLDNPLVVDDRTLFMIGSTSKTFTATALMRLVEQGKAALDDPVLKHLPEFRLKDRRASATLTLRHLVTHSGGWDGDIGLDTGWGDDALRAYVDALRPCPQLRPVGSTWSYNNAGFCVLGRVIEVITGTTFERAVTDLVLHPLGMRDSFYSPVDVLTRRFAVGHAGSGAGTSVAHMLGVSRSLAPAGGLMSTVRDQLAYARFHLGDGRGPDGRRVLTRRSMRLMHSDLFPAGNFADSVGVSWMIRDVGGVRTVAHGGNVSNLQISTFLLAPAQSFAVTAMTNSTGGARLARDFEKWALERYLDARDELPELIHVDAADLAAYQGTYGAQLGRLEVAVRGRRLTLTSRFSVDMDEVPEEERELVRKMLAATPKPLTLGLFARDRVVVTGGPGAGTRGEFLRDRPRGAVRWLRWGGRLHRRTG
jgi:CubicO group peptidase (beta-lactamase class C family)